MSAAPVAPLPGWFGKLPARGDFVVRRLPASFVEPWHAWSVEGLDAAQRLLGPEWLEAFLVAPVRRYWLAPGLLGEAAWAGVWLPSVDRVGRHFPLTLALARRAGTPQASWAAARGAHAWFDALARVACGVLDLDATLADLEERLAALPAFEPAAPADESVPAPARSVWWCGADAGDNRTYAGLPPAAAYPGLLLAPQGAAAYRGAAT
jgi:type VI secretion system protein ImpM